MRLQQTYARRPYTMSRNAHAQPRLGHKQRRTTLLSIVKEVDVWTTHAPHAKPAEVRTYVGPVSPPLFAYLSAFAPPPLLAFRAQQRNGASHTASAWSVVRAGRAA